MKPNEPIRQSDASTDVVVSTCAIRLTEKRALFADALHVLSPGGTLTISDVVVMRAASEAVADTQAARVAAAAHVHRLCSMLCELGFVDVRVDIEARLANFEQYVVSAQITATKPDPRDVVGPRRGSRTAAAV